MESTRRLSPLRVLLAILILAGIGFGSFLGWGEFKESQSNTKVAPWFASYVDVTATPRYSFEQVADHEAEKSLVLSFIVSSKTEACTPTWGGVYTLNDASDELDLDRRIARLRQRGGNIAISFGGLLNDELALNCTDKNELERAYMSVIERYTIDTIDLDLEGEELTNKDSVKRRAEVIADLQKQLRSEGKSLAVWLTLPVAPFGMTQEGTDAVAQFLASGVDLAGVNVMTMDYGAAKSKTDSMNVASQKALMETHRQLGILYKQAGINLNEASVWSKIGATPMIGQNDVVDEIFTLTDAEGLNEFATSKNIARMSMWSANRDIECGENYVNITVVSDSCSGIKQEKLAFTNILSRGFDGNMSQSAAAVTTESPETIEKPDDPAESPYQIWSEEGTYLEGTKVVWRHNVYQAKWWTEGDIPDNPVLQTWETPWQLIGPVLPGEKPVAQPTLAPGTYPEWSGIKIYEARDRVLFNGVPYQAKWWTQGDSPAASTANPDSSPWIVLTQDQIREAMN